MSTDANIVVNALTGGAKEEKIARFDLIPQEALAALAEHYGIGAKKYSAWNWRKGYDWSLSYAALCRHANAFWSGEDLDEETGSPHMVAVAFHALALLTFMTEHAELDDRWSTLSNRGVSSVEAVTEAMTEGGQSGTQNPRSS